MKPIGRNYTIYTVMFILFAVLMGIVIHMGGIYDTKAPAEALKEQAFSPEMLYSTLTLNLRHPFSLLLIQIIAILLCVRLFSYMFKYIGQPGVIGEIVAGIALGPSLLGRFCPEIFSFLFAPESLIPLNVISQIGLVLFMFVIGMELDLGIVRRKASETLVISHASIIVPFLMGMVLAYCVYPEFGAYHAEFLPFALFVAVSMSITAFPVLARIVQERHLSKTPMGMLAIASAANNDVTAWCVLAAVIAVARAGNITGSLFTLGLTILYILFMFYVIKPFLRKIGEIYNNQETVSKTLVAFIILVLIISSYITENLGIHALFGAFLAGVVMPANLSFRRVMTEKIEDIALVLFLPLFFVFTGLRTEIGLLNTSHLWEMCGLFILVAIAGKMIGATASARMVGESWKDSLSIGVLMNTRGLMELIVLNIGYEMGIIPSSLFVIFVIMALFTTFMATPMLMAIEKIFNRKAKKAMVASPVDGPRILISFANPENAPTLLHVAHLLYGETLKRAHITAIHYTIGTDTNLLNTTDYANACFTLLEAQAKQLSLPIETRYRVTDRFTEDLSEVVKAEHFNLVLTGSGHSFLRNYFDTPSRKSLGAETERLVSSLLNKGGKWLPGGFAQDKIRLLFQELPATLGVNINRETSDRVTDVAVILRDDRDHELLGLTQTISSHLSVSLSAVDTELSPTEETQGFKTNPSLTIDRQPGLTDRIRDKQLVVLSYGAWQYIARYERPLLRMLPSFIIVRPAPEVPKTK